MRTQIKLALFTFLPFISILSGYAFAGKSKHSPPPPKHHHTPAPPKRAPLPPPPVVNQTQAQIDAHNAGVRELQKKGLPVFMCVTHGGFCGPGNPPCTVKLSDCRPNEFFGVSR